MSGTGLKAPLLLSDSYKGSPRQLVAGSAKVWANVDATSGTPTITKSQNLSSLIDNAVGHIRHNFTVNMSNRLFPAAASGQDTDTTNGDCFIGEPSDLNRNTGLLSVKSITAGNTAIDAPKVCLSVHGDLA